MCSILNILHYTTDHATDLKMLNEVSIFELRFNYSYLNSNAGDSVFVCKSVKRVNSKAVTAVKTETPVLFPKLTGTETAVFLAPDEWLFKSGQQA